MCGLTFKSAQTYTPGSEKSGKFGQLPSWPGSPPMRTQAECEGVGPSRTKSWYQAGGDTWELGGATTVQVVPAQENSGKSVRASMALPCVEDVAVADLSQCRTAL